MRNTQGLLPTIPRN